MKRFLTIALMLCVCLAIGVFADEAKLVTVTLNGETVDCASYGQEATIVEGRTLVPLRAIFEALGASVEWNAETRTVVSRLDTTMIDLTVGEKELRKFTLDSEGYIIDGQTVILDVPAMIMNGRTMVPARAVSESFGVAVEWDGETRTVILSDGLVLYNSYLENILEQIEPKAELDKEILAYAGGIPISAATVRSAVMAACSSDRSLDDESTKAAIEALFTENAALVKFAYNDRIILDEADTNQIKASVVGLQLQLGENYDKAFAESPYTKYFYYLNSAVYPVVYSKITALYSDGSNEEINKKVVEYFEENDYVRAKHILIQFADDTEKAREDAFNRILDVLVKVNAMEDISEFDALIEEYNEDPGMAYNPYGYYFTKGEMVEPFEKATYALEEGKTSSIVETDYGYHIILRLPVNDENLVKTDAFSEVAFQVIKQMILNISDGMEVKYADNYDERVQDFIKEYEELMALLNQA